VSGNHDSDVLTRRLAGAGAIVLTERGRLRADGGLGPVVVNVGGLRVAGYSDPFERRRSGRYRDRGSEVTEAHQREFADWLRPLVGRVDVVMTHEPGLTELAVEELRADPPRTPLAVLTGHTHVPELRTSENVVELNGGTAGGGGTGNLEKNQPFGLAVLVRESGRPFAPLLADTVEIDVQSGEARAERTRLDLDGGG
jgi:predicted phosphodiesterase